MPHDISGQNQSIGQFIANSLMEGRDLLETAQKSGSPSDWERVLAYPDFWAVRHEKGGVYSVKAMTDEEIRQSIVEDLLFVAVETARGSATSYPCLQAIRHLGTATDQIPRINKAIVDVIASGMVLLSEDAHLQIDPTKIDAAQAFSGVYVFEWDAASEDWVDLMISAGGEALLGDAIDDLAAELPPMNPSS
jgi:hypothetical protein